jgi:hypothetical protein
VTPEIVITCRICGGQVRSETPANWHPGKRVRRAERDLQAHLRTHTFAELLRYEIRQDLDQVPEEQRPMIVRDIYRSLLGTTQDQQFSLNATDGEGTYSIEEVLGDLSLYRLWSSANRCGDPGCQQHQTS